MVEDQIIKRGIEDQRVLDVMRVVERHKFVPEKYSESAYKDGPLPIGCLLYTSPSPRDLSTSRMPSSA